MGIYLNSADPADARRAQELGFIAGITTNSALIARTGRPSLDVLGELAEIIDGHIFYQPIGATTEARADDAWAAYKIRPDKVLLKLPATTENFTLVSRLVPAGIECAITSIYSPAQAFLSTRVRASFAIPYYSRLKRDVPDALRVLRRMVDAVRDTQTQILVASFDSVDEVSEALEAGIQHLTLPLELILALGEHDLTRRDIRDSGQRPDD